MASACPHGFAPSSCLICQTLAGSSSGSPAAPAPVVTAGRSMAREARPLEPARRAPLGLRMLGAGIVVVVAILALWWALTLVWAVLRMLELVAVAGAAGYAGWKLGVRHGRRSTR